MPKSNRGICISCWIPEELYSVLKEGPIPISDRVRTGLAREVLPALLRRRDVLDERVSTLSETISRLEAPEV